MEINSQDSQSNRSVIDYESFFNATTLRRRRSPLRADAKNMPGPGVVFLTGGFPPDEMFPIIQTELTLRDGTVLKVDNESMKKAMQYSKSDGITELVQWMTEFITRVHKPPTMNRHGNDKLKVMISAGSQDAISHCFNMLLSEGDTLLIQNPSYPTMFNMVEPLGVNIVGIESDQHGMLPSHMREVLENWEKHNPIGLTAPRPKILYCIPTGDNPRGCSWTVDRRHEIYSICQQYNLLIMEDDAYYFSYFTRPLPPSLLSLDIDGRVIRFDTFSKVLGPGLRMGYISAPEAIIDKIITVYQSSSVGASTLSQYVTITLLRHWGYDGYLKQCERVAHIFREKVKDALEAADKYLKDICEWDAPSAGMFLWIKLKRLPDAQPVVTKCRERGVLIVAGFNAIPQVSISPYIRIACTPVSREIIFSAFQTIAECAVAVEKEKYITNNDL